MPRRMLRRRGDEEEEEEKQKRKARRGMLFGVSFGGSQGIMSLSRFNPNFRFAITVVHKKPQVTPSPGTPKLQSSQQGAGQAAPQGGAGGQQGGGEKPGQPTKKTTAEIPKPPPGYLEPPRVGYLDPPPLTQLTPEVEERVKSDFNRFWKQVEGKIPRGRESDYAQAINCLVRSMWQDAEYYGWERKLPFTVVYGDVTPPSPGCQISYVNEESWARSVCLQHPQYVVAYVTGGPKYYKAVICANGEPLTGMY